MQALILSVEVLLESNTVTVMLLREAAAGGRPPSPELRNLSPGRGIYEEPGREPEYGFQGVRGKRNGLRGPADSPLAIRTKLTAR